MLVFLEILKKKKPKHLLFSSIKKKIPPLDRKCSDFYQRESVLTGIKNKIYC